MDVKTGIKGGGNISKVRAINDEKLCTNMIDNVLKSHGT